MTKNKPQTKTLEALIEDLETDPCDQTFKSLHYLALSLVADMEWENLSYMNMRLLLVDLEKIDEKYQQHFEVLTEAVQKFQTHLNLGVDLYDEALQVAEDEDLYTLLLALNHSGTMGYEEFKRKTSGMSNLQYAVSRAKDQNLIQITQKSQIKLSLKGRKTLTIIQNNDQ